MHVNVVMGRHLDEHLFFWKPAICIILYVIALYLVWFLRWKSNMMMMIMMMVCLSAHKLNKHHWAVKLSCRRKYWVGAMPSQTETPSWFSKECILVP